MNGPVTGELFDVKGYEQVAAIQMASEGYGMVLVMHNNSTHILVATQRDEENLTVAVLRGSFPYYTEEGDYAIAYRHALDLATELAVNL